jgi:hypothetical protein
VWTVQQRLGPHRGEGAVGLADGQPRGTRGGATSARVRSLRGVARSVREPFRDPVRELVMSRGPDLEGFWPGRRLDAFDGLCPGAAPSRAPATSG